MSDSTTIDSLPGGSPQSNIKMTVTENAPVQQAQQQQSPTSVALASDPTTSLPIAPKQVDPNAMNQVMRGLQQAHMDGMTHLSARDIPMHTTQLTQDQQIKPNYLPDATNQNYIKEEDTYDSILKKNSLKKQNNDRLDLLYDELQLPILIMVLFFLFQMPFVQKKFSNMFPSLFLRDGNMTMGGYVTKTALFGVSFYLIMKLTKYASEL